MTARLPTTSPPPSVVLDRPLPPCCAVALLWLGGGALACALFPALRGVVGGLGWMPLFLLVMPLCLLLVGAWRNRAGEVDQARLSRRQGGLRPRRGAVRRRWRPRMARWPLAALFAGFAPPRG